MAARLMRLTIAAALVLATVGLSAGLLARQPERASADYNLNGEWLYHQNEDACPATIVQANSGTYVHPIVVTLASPCTPYNLNLTIDVRDGHVTGAGEDGYPWFDGYVSGGGHVISGIWFYRFWNGTFHMTGGAGEPKFPTPTSTPCPGPCPTTTATDAGTSTPPPTPPPVAGVALDTPTSGGAFGAWWVTAVAVATFVAFAGAAIRAQRTR
jgi:hypothetical protein